MSVLSQILLGLLPLLQKIIVDDLFTMSEDGAYHYKNGTNPVAVKALLIAAAFSLGSVVVPKLMDAGEWVPKYSWFIGCGVGLAAYYLLAISANVAGSADRRAGRPAAEAPPTDATPVEA